LLNNTQPHFITGATAIYCMYKLKFELSAGGTYMFIGLFFGSFYNLINNSIIVLIVVCSKENLYVTVIRQPIRKNEHV